VHKAILPNLSASEGLNHALRWRSGSDIPKLKVESALG
jgi:hypothetical protein